MLIGVPKEIKDHEYRCATTPSGVRELVEAGNQVLVQKNAGLAIDFTDQQYREAGAKIANDAQEIYEKSEMILKVKEPQKSECELIKKQQIIFSYLHLSAEPTLTKNLLKSGCRAIAFETVTANDRSLPLLAPMSEVAGKLSIQAGARALEKSQGGRGVLLGGVPGSKKSKGGNYRRRCFWNKLSKSRYWYGCGGCYSRQIFSTHSLFMRYFWQ